ncbi:MAG: O-antigen ligase family protein [Verrucomicrobia bacterium]|nr:O-antigen ligase family protein [Verrucomicrobiota bacterium]
MDPSLPSDPSELQKPLDQFRAKTRRLRIHELESVVLAIVCVNLVIMPWLLGGMKSWSQFISLGLAVVGLVVALVPRNYTEEHTGSNAFRLVMWPKLLKFPIFWIGVALLGLIALRALNPAWRYESNGKEWWMTKVAHIEWLPAGVEAPFERWGPWRILMIYATALMVVCTIWVGFTRRRTLQLFFLVLASNGMALACVGIAQRLIPNTKMFWLFDPPFGATFFAGFIYKNHGGAYLLLSLVVTCGLAGWYFLRGQRRLEKSNPAGLFAFFATVTAVAVLVSYARGATITMVGFLVICITGLFIHQLFFAKDSRRPVVLVVLLLVFGLFMATGLRALNSGQAWTRLQAGLVEGGDTSVKLRVVANHAAYDMLVDNWKMGVGSGGFGFLFPIYQQHYPEIFRFPTGGRQFWWHAHNDWLELPIELGLPGLLLVVAAGGSWAVALLRRYFWENSLSLVVVLGACAVAAYSFFDFPFQNPAILTLWCALWPAATVWVRLEDQRA